ncbi:uncharacterized protein LOC120352021 [Nilaparvata lugens]|uniref:uncharacterized protein LOC120352021 n=1 Tax=Nilaparvata lugens TaxID=108931 RepID=UPI00193C99E0|nr:uncharacterized protein LOC120352021 [Nilaparvata lugens]
MFECFKTDIFTELKTVKDEVTELTKSVVFLSASVDASNTLMAELKNSIETLKAENTILRETSNTLSNQVTDLQERVRSLEQYTRRSNIEISGVPATPKEEVIKLVMDVGAAIDVAVEESHINAAHRVAGFRNDRAPSLIVQFTHRAIRDQWIKKYRENKESITAYNINPAFKRSKVYINEHLAPVNKVFLAKLKAKYRAVRIKYVWCHEGKFFIRRSDGEKCQKVMSGSDIDNLK